MTMRPPNNRTPIAVDECAIREICDHIRALHGANCRVVVADQRQEIRPTAGTACAKAEPRPAAPREDAGEGIGKAIPVLIIVVREPEPEAGGAPRPDPAEPEGFETLTAVERNLVEHIVDGRTVRQASQEMGISYHTARKYLQTIYSKLDVHRQSELAALCAPHLRRNRH